MNFLDFNGPRGRIRSSGFIGFLGFLGFRYFATGSLGWLVFFGYFSYFAYFLVARLATDMPDERYHENQLKAKAALFFPSSASFFVLAVLIALVPFPAVMVCLCALLFAALNIGYAVMFYRYENE